MRQENYEAVKPFEAQFETAIKAQWARNISPSMAATLERVWREESGNDRFMLHRNCSACILDILQRVGKLYYAHQPEKKPKPRTSKK